MKPLTKKVIRWFLMVALIIAVLAVLIFAIGGSLKKTFLPFAKTEWVIVERMDCSVDAFEWKKSEGWCQAKKVHRPGHYRFVVRVPNYDGVWEMKMANGAFQKMPLDGIALSFWGNSPFVAEFWDEAPVKKPWVGRLIARTGPEGTPFEALRTDGFEIEKEGNKQPELSFNLPHKPDYFTGNKVTKMLVQLQREE